MSSSTTNDNFGMDGSKCLHEMFRDQVKKTPNNIAVKCDHNNGQGLTYKELDLATDKLAVMLIKHGVKKDSAVGILMERSTEYVLSYIAIHKAGGAYLPLDPAYPEHLLKDVLNDSTPAVVLCKRSFVARLPEDQTAILLDGSWDQCLTEMVEGDAKLLENVDGMDLDQLGYIVYSSGTTGKPKGIACPHRGAVFSYTWRFENIPYEQETEVEGCNVFFVWEMLRPLLQGKTLCVIPDDVIYDPNLLSAFVEKMQITRMLFTPSLLEAVLDCKSIPFDMLVKRLGSLTCIVLCGEVVTVALQERCKESLPNVDLWNLYSVSECHDVAAINLKGGNYGSRKYCPVGKIFVGVEAYVLDETLGMREIGEVGELYVAGPTLAREYIGLGTLTNERFPTIQGKRMYKTGDRARVLPNRELEILGRCDSMVKVRGYSVELRAIEAAIMGLNDLVSSCCVTVQGEEGQDKFVIGYIVLKPDATCRKVRLELKAKLPHYMVPAFLVEMDELPTNEVSGKLNVKALPKVDLATGTPEGRKARTVSSDGDCTLPRNEMEMKLHKLWCQTMNMQQIDVVYDSFFDIGGHSLLAAKLVEKIKTDMNMQIGVVDLFANPTIEMLGNFLTSGGTSGGTATNKLVDKVDLITEANTFDASTAVNDIAMRAFWRTTHFRQVKARTVLITGATGFLGSFLLFELLNCTEIDVVYCIVRKSTNPDDANSKTVDRVKLSLEKRGLWKEEFQERIVVFEGDASLYHLGLDDDDYAALSTGVDLVVHCAALVNLVYPYEGMRSANVIGTRNMIEFALFGKVKRFGYISTNGVFPDGLKGCKEDADTSDFPNQLTNGYSQSKWVAEELVRRAANKGLPVIIFRPGNMGGDFGTFGGKKTWNSNDFNYLMLTGCIDLGVAPDVPGWVMEMTPVDIAANAIVTILQDGKSLGNIYHVTNSQNCLEASEYFDAIRNMGYSIEKCSFAEWKAKLDQSLSPSLAQLKNACVSTTHDSLVELSTFDNTNFHDACLEAEILLPKISQSIIHEYVETWQQLGIVTPPIHPGRPLAGKVALITGASSGIGEGIAKILAEAGASVSLGGRRLEKLEEIAQDISSKTGAKVVCFKVDVTVRDQVKAFVAKSESALGPTDIFVNNAGVMHYTLMKNGFEEQWEKEVDVNCKGLLNGIGAVLPKMLERGKGHIVVTSSDAGRKVFPGLSVYSGTKFFAEAVCQGLRLETAETGIKVTTIQPGDCKTELSTLTTDEEARAQCAQSSDERKYWLDPIDVAQAVLFAVSAPNHVGINEILIEPRAAPA